MIDCSYLVALAVLLAGCGQGSGAGHAPRQDGAVDLGRSVPPDGSGRVEAGTKLDGAPDRVTPVDFGSGSDRTGESGISPDLAVDSWPGFDRAADLDVAVDGRADRGAGLDLTSDLRTADLAVGADAGPDRTVDASDLDVAGPAKDAAAEGAQGDTSADGGCAMVENISVGSRPSIDFHAYHDEAQMEAYLQAVASAFPAIAVYKVLGQSGQGRDVPYLIINATCQAGPPGILVNGTHHGDEPASTEAVLALPDYLLRTSTTDASVRGLLEHYAFYVMPLVNPDGFAMNTRENAAGLDINRDYSYPERSDADSFKTVEARLVKSLQESVGFHAAIAYHSGAQEVLWPWCYTADATAEGSFFATAGERTAQAMNFAIAQQSYDDYPTQGEYIDYSYWKDRTLAATFEVSTVKAPGVASLDSVVSAACAGAVAWAQAVSDHDNGRLHALSTTAPARRRFPLTAPFDGIQRLE